MVVLVRPSSVKPLSACVGLVVERAFSLSSSLATATGHVSQKDPGRQSKKSPSASSCSRLRCAGGPLMMGGCWRAGPL